MRTICALYLCLINFDLVCRKYGKIPNRIYMLYLKACGLYIVFIFCVSAFGWQALRIYTDVWLRGWTDIDYDSNGTEEVG